MGHYLILLAVIPLSCFYLTKIFDTEDKWLYRGLSVGLVIAPLSYGLLQFTFVPVVGKFIGIIGLLLNLTHGTLGYFCLAGSGFLEPGVVLSASQITLINLVNAGIFATCYGMIGYSIDRKIQAEERAAIWN
jgi:hypothetical protein